MAVFANKKKRSARSQRGCVCVCVRCAENGESQGTLTLTGSYSIFSYMDYFLFSMGFGHSLFILRQFCLQSEMCDPLGHTQL